MSFETPKAGVKLTDDRAAIQRRVVLFDPVDLVVARADLAGGAQDIRSVDLVKNDEWEHVRLLM